MQAKSDFELKDILMIIKKYGKMIVLTTVSAALLFFLYAALFMTREYQAQAMLIVNTSSGTSQTITYDDVNLSQKLVDTYAIIMKSTTILNKVINSLDLKLTSQQLAGKITVQGVGTTEVIQLTVTDSNPDRAKKIANSIIGLAPSEIIRTVKAGSVEVISPAETNSQPVSPNISSITMIGAVIGLLASFITVFVMEKLDDRLKSVEDIQEKLGYSLIGVIPEIKASPQETRNLK